MSDVATRSEFEAMFRATYDRVLAYVLRRAEPGEAEDVVADTYAVAWRKFEMLPADPLPWLYAVARRIMSNSRRSIRRRILLATRIAGEMDPSAAIEADPGERLENATLMRAAVRGLKPADREILMLVAWEGLGSDRAAATLGVSTQAFATRLHRARRRLEVEIDRLSSRRAPESVGVTERRKR